MNDDGTVNAQGLGGLNLSNRGDAFQLEITRTTQDATIQLEVFSGAPTPPKPTTPIPTMGEWGLMIFGLMILNLSVVFVREKELA